MANLINNWNLNNLNIKNLNNENTVTETKNTDTTLKGKSFDQILFEKENIKFSSHAIKRMKLRNIKIDNEELLQLKEGVNKIREKGGQESVILMNEKAFAVSVKNNTVVTVVDDKSMKDNVFTKIDSMLMI